MFKVTRYCVQVFERERPPDAARQFRDRNEALEVGRLAARRAAGVAVYEVTGEPVQDLWREPRMIAAFGSMARLRRDTEEPLNGWRESRHGGQHCERSQGCRDDKALSGEVRHSLN